jgi:hypothetical protein
MEAILLSQAFVSHLAVSRKTRRWEAFWEQVSRQESSLAFDLLESVNTGQVDS